MLAAIFSRHFSCKVVLLDLAAIAQKKRPVFTPGGISNRRRMKRLLPGSSRSLYRTLFEVGDTIFRIFFTKNSLMEEEEGFAA